MSDYSLLTDSSGLQLILLPNPNIEHSAPIFVKSVIELAKKHNVYSVLLAHDLDETHRELPDGTCYPGDLYFALTEAETLQIENLWSRGCVVIRIYEAEKHA